MHNFFKNKKVKLALVSCTGSFAIKTGFEEKLFLQGHPQLESNLEAALLAFNVFVIMISFQDSHFH